MPQKPHSRERQDRELFDRIAHQYAQKDVYPPSRHARAYLVQSLFEMLYDRTGAKPGQLLDLGCGVGAAAAYLHGMYQRYVGVDHSAELIEIARRRYAIPEVEFFNGNIKDLNLPGFSPDFIFGNGVLHHVDDLPELMSTLYQMGGPHTYYGFIEPQSGNPIIQALRWARKQIDPAYSEDQIFFSKASLGQLFTDHGFELIEVWHHGYFSTPLAQVMLKPESIFMPLSRMAVRIDRSIHQRYSSSLAWNLQVIARKLP